MYSTYISTVLEEVSQEESQSSVHTGQCTLPQSTLCGSEVWSVSICILEISLFEFKISVNFVLDFGHTSVNSLRKFEKIINAEERIDYVIQYLLNKKML